MIGKVFTQRREGAKKIRKEYQSFFLCISPLHLCVRFFRRKDARMPEGDTIFRTAATLRRAIEGGRIERADSRNGDIDCGPLAGNTLAAVEARGKHLLMHLESRHALHSHMGMDGSWHLYYPDQPWRKSPKSAALVLRINKLDAVCFLPKLLELLTADQLRTHRYLRKLGPDLLARDFDMPAAVRRFRVHDAVPLGEAVMNQTIACGVGNVYKSDVLFLLGFDPLAPVGAYADDELARLLAKARALLRANLTGAPRKTRFRGDGRRLWAYGRAGEPCFKCGDPIQITRQGDQGRTTFWCLQCQPARERGSR
jgi:endonuclease-8